MQDFLIEGTQKSSTPSCYGTTPKYTLLESVPVGVTTWTEPVVAPVGTVVVISVFDTTVKTATTPLKLMLVVAPVRL
jgi:hypothetical protein